VRGGRQRDLIETSVRCSIACSALGVDYLPQSVRLEDVLSNPHSLNEAIPHDLQQGAVDRASKRMHRIAARVNDEM
jgi:hypothetical protein